MKPNLKTCLRYAVFIAIFLALILFWKIVIVALLMAFFIAGIVCSICTIVFFMALIVWAFSNKDSDWDAVVMFAWAPFVTLPIVLVLNGIFS